MGTGTFGKVFECFDSKHKDVVAVKVVRSIKRYVESARIEAEVLDVVYEKMKTWKGDYCVKMFSHFSLNGT
jgi:dual-specificity kinase